MPIGSAWTPGLAGITIGSESAFPGGVAPSIQTVDRLMPQKPTAAMSSAGFVHLHVHSAYSLLKGSIKIQKLGELAKADRQPALALTDTDNMFGALEFSDKMAGYGIQPIIGCELAVDFGDQDANARNGVGAVPSRIVLLAARERGYRSLMRLNSRAFLETPVHQAPHIKFGWLEGETDGSDRADRRSRRADIAGLPRRSGRHLRLLDAIGWRAYSATGSMSNCSATASKGSAASRLA